MGQQIQEIKWKKGRETLWVPKNKSICFTVWPRRNDLVSWCFWAMVSSSNWSRFLGGQGDGISLSRLSESAIIDPTFSQFPHWSSRRFVKPCRNWTFCLPRGWFLKSNEQFLQYYFSKIGKMCIYKNWPLKPFFMDKKIVLLVSPWSIFSLKL